MEGPLLRNILARGLRLTPALERRLRNVIKAARPDTTILLEYSIHCEPRYGYGKPAHPQIYAILNGRRDAYASLLSQFSTLRSRFLKILALPGAMETEPSWINPYFPALDAMALYAFLTLRNPRRYLEIGSGNSTKVARRAITDNGLRTKLVSLDPQPREEINRICDRIIRQPLEDMDLSLFDQLEEQDIVFMDGSHRVFMNSDATVFFLEVLPMLKPGVLIHLHDIFLPWDYPSYAYIERKHWSEQYLLAVALMTSERHFEILLPNAFIMQDQELAGIVEPFFADLEASGGQALGRCRGGSSFWMRKQ